MLAAASSSEVLRAGTHVLQHRVSQRQPQLVGEITCGSSFGVQGAGIGPIFAASLVRAWPGSGCLRQPDWQGDGGDWRGTEAGPWLNTQGAALQGGEVHGQETEEREQQHGHDPLAGRRDATQRVGVEDEHCPRVKGHVAAVTDAEPGLLSVPPQAGLRPSLGVPSSAPTFLHASSPTASSLGPRCSPAPSPSQGA
ncbi:hypothetical protein P7K49_035082 [Saguinus oedipus]|uniref:Uncharacterized protein n=1 Tax=Saguinus oedipus TaxID=9490 RepID=A0ABQ9TXE4_SAGOE|nr:hypothetical protein P7K49_035082 [Saguinus oedipus]